MIRTATFAILAVVVALGVYRLVYPGGWESENLLFLAMILVAWFGLFDVCDRGRFADYLGKVDEEAEQIAWPNRIALLHGATLVVSLIVVLCIAFCGIGALVNYIAEIFS